MNKPPLDKRALGTWIRAWQLAGNRWPPESRAIAHQIVMMLAHQLEEVAKGRISADDAFLLARETMLPLLAQRFYTGSEQDIAIERIQEALKYASEQNEPQ
ncbi:MAG: hypothetical protein ACI9EW_002827 [Cellvibrionaceae bacterium]|jgi:hypothetical protein